MTTLITYTRKKQKYTDKMEGDKLCFEIKGKFLHISINNSDSIHCRAYRIKDIINIVIKN